MRLYFIGNLSNDKSDQFSKFELFLFIKAWNYYLKCFYYKSKDFKSCDGLKGFVKLKYFGHKTFIVAQASLMSNEQVKKTSCPINEIFKHDAF